MKILVTGGAGFIGINLARNFLNNGHSVIVYDNLSRSDVHRNIDWLIGYNYNNFSFLNKDVLDTESLKTAIVGVDVVLHYAGQVSVVSSIDNPRFDFEQNVLGTFNLLEVIRKYNKECLLIYASTNKVYGNIDAETYQLKDNRYQPKNRVDFDENLPLSFHSPYGCSKGAADQYCLDYSRSFGLKTIVLRQSCIYGERQFGHVGQGWAYHIMRKIVSKEEITIFGDGYQVRDILYISDLCNLIDKICQKASGFPEVYNVGGGVDNSVSIIDYIQLIQDSYQLNPKIKFDKPRIGDQLYFVSDNGRAMREFDWKPKVGIKHGIELLYSWVINV